MKRADALRYAKARYAQLASGTAHVLDRMGASPGHAPGAPHRVRHWAYSLRLIHDAAGLAALDMPWWTYRGAAAVDEWIERHPRPVRAFEYGSGASTAWLARRVDEVHSAEHDRVFAASFAPVVAGYANVRMHVVAPTPAAHPLVGSAKAGYHGQDFSDYVAAIDGLDGDFDLIVIDGRARQACLRAALRRLSPDGIVVFDDSWRRRYRPAIAAADVQEHAFRGLTPTMPYPGQTSVLRPGRRR